MSKNRRVSLNHAVHLALHGCLSKAEIVEEAQKFATFLDELPTLSVEAGDIDVLANVVKELANYPVSEFRRKNANILIECLAGVEPLTLGKVIAAGPRYLFDLDVTQSRRLKILEDIWSVCDAFEVELEDLEEHVLAQEEGPTSSLWSNGCDDYLFNGDAAIAGAPLSFKAIAGAPLSFKEAILQQREVEAATQPAEPIDSDKPRCGCPDHTPFTAEELPGVTIDRLDVTTDTVDLLSGRGINTVQGLQKAGPVALNGLPERDQIVLITFAKALDEQMKSGSFNAEPAPVLQEVDGYLGLPIDSFADISPAILADLQSKGVNCLRDLFENPMLIPGCLVYGMEEWLKLTSHLLNGLKAEIEERADMTEADREVLRVKLADLTRLMELAKATVSGESKPTMPSLLEMLRHRGATMMEPVVLSGDSPQGQALLAMLRQRVGNPQATSGLVKVNSDTDPALSSLLDNLFGGKEPTKH